jgi:hypothetical protein
MRRSLPRRGDPAVAHVLKRGLDRMGEMFDLATTGNPAPPLMLVGGAKQLFDVRSGILAAALDGDQRRGHAGEVLARFHDELMTLA